MKEIIPINRRPRNEIKNYLQIMDMTEEEITELNQMLLKEAVDDAIERSKIVDPSRYKDVLLALKIINANILKKLMMKMREGLPATDKEMELLFRYVYAKDRTNESIYGTKSIKEEKSVLEVVQRRILELNVPHKKKRVIINDNTGDNRKELLGKEDGTSESDGNEVQKV